MKKNVEGIKFALPKTTHELIYIGQELHNCVATYAPKAVSKECTIVYMEQNGELVGCIEIDTTGKYIIQARGHCNELFEGELLRIFNKYVAITGLSTYTCSQQTAAELAGLNPNAHEVLVGLDFHNLEIDENGHVTEI